MEFASSYGDHLPSQRAETIQLARFDPQLDVPRNLLIHTLSKLPSVQAMWGRF
jgi:hypothetical protein